MKIIKEGTVVSFVCVSCDCEFLVGVNSTRCNDGNYYTKCPMCGTECHANVTDVIVPGLKKEKKGDIAP